MNINLLRPPTDKAKNRSHRENANVLGDSSDSDEVDTSSSRATVNQAIKNEQEALRKRALEATKRQPQDVYDYDGMYDSFCPIVTNDKEADKNKSSRYIGDLLKAAEKRKRERDVVYEHKVAREQTIEDAQADYRDKGKFITSGYKRKLQERELWQLEESKKLLEEEANDVAKTAGGIAMANFYGNMNRNVAMGAKSVAEEAAPGDEEPVVKSDLSQQTETAKPKLSFMEGFEKSVEKEESKAGYDIGKGEAKEGAASLHDLGVRNQTMREIREQKVKEARERYFQRRQ
jgi:hypothetical protein